MTLDVRCLPYMPLHIERLRRSKAWLRCKRNPALAFYILNMWMRAWHEVPAGSIEDDDDVLADAAMCSPREWARLKDDVLQGWELRDWRWHHHVVEELAAEGSEKIEGRRKRTEAARVARLQGRQASVTENVTSSVTENATENVTGSNRREGEGKGREGNRKEESPSSSLRSDEPPLLATIERDECADALQAYNATAREMGWAEAQVLNDRRRAALKGRLRECGGMGGWRSAMARARASPFLAGENDRSWRPDLDFFLQQKSFTRLMEGFYDRREGDNTGGSRTVRSGSAARNPLLAAAASVLAEHPDSEFGRRARDAGFGGPDGGGSAGD
ncbi:DUF1376 domain-containing protein [Xanthobacter flavus]|uniref:DUF1376 domain-containing protein n=1 Tax=Xanthobacter flavus TaxID=281 RepID=UPI0037292F1A